MTKTVSVSGYNRSKPAKPKEYIDRHLALFPRRSDAIRFLDLNNVPIVTTDDPRLPAPIPDPVYGFGRMSLADISEQLAALAKLAAKIGRR